MKKLIMSLVVLGACKTTVATSTTMTTPSVGLAPAPATTPVSYAHSGSQTGASDPISAVRGFMAAAKGTDLGTLGALWGDRQGPAREKMPRDELEKRELYMARCLRHDHYEIAGDAPALNGARAMVLNLKLGEISRSADFQVVLGPSERWYIQDINLPKLQDICMSRG